MSHPVDNINTLTKRELFAAMMMQGLISSGLTLVTDRIHMSEDALQFADALIAELDKE